VRSAPDTETPRSQDVDLGTKSSGCQRRIRCFRSKRDPGGAIPVSLRLVNGGRRTF